MSMVNKQNSDFKKVELSAVVLEQYIQHSISRKTNSILYFNDHQR